MNPKLQKITDETEKIRAKILSYTVRLRELERQKTELENADIVALVRGIDIPPGELEDFVKAFKERREYSASDNDNSIIHEKTENKEEDLALEN